MCHIFLSCISVIEVACTVISIVFQAVSLFLHLTLLDVFLGLYLRGQCSADRRVRQINNHHDHCSKTTNLYNFDLLSELQRHLHPLRLPHWFCYELIVTSPQPSHHFSPKGNQTYSLWSLSSLQTDSAYLTRANVKWQQINISHWYLYMPSYFPAIPQIWTLYQFLPERALVIIQTWCTEPEIIICITGTSWKCLFLMHWISKCWVRTVGMWTFFSASDVMCTRKHLDNHWFYMSGTV